MNRAVGIPEHGVLVAIHALSFTAPDDVSGAIDGRSIAAAIGRAGGRTPRSGHRAAAVDECVTVPQRAVVVGSCHRARRDTPLLLIAVAQLLAQSLVVP